MITNKMVSDSHRLAKSLSPYLSGNTRYNAIHIRNRSSNGFTIEYNMRDADYIEYVEEGTSKQKGQHFILNTYLELCNYFANVEQRQQKNNNQSNRMARTELNRDLYRENKDYRELIHQQSINRFNSKE